MNEAISSFIQFLVEEEPWQREAACRDSDTSLFFPERGSSTRPAKKLCASCPVRVECDDYAYRTGSVGIWAGRSRRLRSDDRHIITGQAESEIGYEQSDQRAAS